ncbi:type II toxin-antitoxin system Phd/YefM family antitoxin [Devosia sp.]|uniref:type II toxin-antitoxin system Phd/YefM family antitoxin n=1 Tax=Devosia sp. TaxID=1871048 RepID=UPI002F231BA9
MNAPPKFPRQTPPKTVTMTSREFNQNTSRAKAAADHGPVVITDRGRPAYVLLTHSEFARLTTKVPRMSALAALADPDYRESDPDLMEFIPPRTVESTRFTFDDVDE